MQQLANIFFPSSVSVKGVGSGASATSTTNIPPAVQALPGGTIIKGQISGRNAAGDAVLQTPQGELALKTNIFMKRGVEVSIKLEKAMDELMAKILTIDGKSVSKYVDGLQNKQATSEVLLQSTLQALGKTDASGTVFTTSTALKALLMPKLQQQANLQQTTAQTTSTNLSSGQATTTSAAPSTQAMPSTAPASASIASQPNAGGALSNLNYSQQAAMSALPPKIAAIIAAAPQGAELEVKAPQQAATNTTAATTTRPNAQTQPATSQNTTVATNNSTTNTPQTIASNTTQTPNVAATQTTAQNPQVSTTAPSNPANQTNNTLPTSTTTIDARPATMPATQSTTTPAAAPSATTNSPSPTTATAPNVAPSNAANAPVSAPQTSTSSMPSSPTVTSPPNAAPTLTPTNASQTQTYQPSTSTPTTPQAASATPTATTPAPNIASTADVKATIPAVVIQSSPNAAQTLQTPLGTMRLFTPTPLPLGTQMQLEVTAAAPQALSAGMVANSIKELGAFDELQQVNMMAAAEGKPSLAPIPQAASKELTTDILFFLAALKGGDVKKWLHDKTSRVLDKNEPALLARLGTEFGQLRGNQVEAREAGQWNVLSFPIGYGEDVSPVHMYYRHSERDNNDNATHDETDHFVVDVRLTNLGDIQFDGFVTKPDKNQLSFDLMVRTDAKLPDDVQKGIRDIYGNAQEITGFKGSMSFRVGANARLDLAREVAAEGNTPLTPPDTDSLIV